MNDMEQSLPERHDFDSVAPDQDRSVVLHFVYKQGIHAAEIENLKASRDKHGERIGDLALGMTRIESEQKHAADTRRMQHDETMAQMGELSARLDRLTDLPAQMAVFLERQSQLIDRAAAADTEEAARRGRSFVIGMPEPSPRMVLALIALIVAVLAALRSGWPELFKDLP